MCQNAGAFAFSLTSHFQRYAATAAERAAAVDERDRAADLAGELARRVRRAFDARLARVAAARELLLRAHELRVRARRETHAEQR